MARAQLPLDLIGRAVEDHADSPRRKPKQVVLYLHLSEAALTGTEPLGRVGSTRTPVTAEQIRDWCGPPTRCVKPVIDLNGRVHVTPTRSPTASANTSRSGPHLRVRLVHPTRRDQPTPTTSSPRTPRCDTGGETATDNIAPLCRSHHRAKTHGGWTLTVLSPASTCGAHPHGLVLLRDHTGTRLLHAPHGRGSTHRQAQDGASSTDGEP